MTSDGTVMARSFINQASEKDRLNSLLGKLSKATRNSDIKNSKPNLSICKFTTGKVYNADLSASYNIGARYFIREIIKPLSEKTRLQLEAKVPLLAARNQHTLSTLISLKAAC